MGRSSGRGARDVEAPTRVGRVLRVLAGVLALAALSVPGILAPVPAFALRAAEYPSWAEVQQARANEAATAALRTQLESQLVTIQAEAQRAQEEADAKGQVYAEAQQAYDEQYAITQALLEQTAAAQAEADEAYSVAAQVIAEMSKGGGGDMTPQLFTTPGSPDALLERLELSRVLGERYAGLYTKALELRNRAEALADQAEVAQQLLEELKIAAEAAYEVAKAAAIAAAEKLAQTQKDVAEVRQRLDYLARLTDSTEAAYEEGVRAQWGSNAEGPIVNGWARPAAGYISSNFGWRIDPINGRKQYHSGVDLAGQGCGAPIRATHSGTVTYAGWYGSWGYYVAIDHGDGTGSGYAHIQAGGIGVSIGQQVGPGQQIAKVGTTGHSTGCHLHFIMRVNGDRDLTDPVVFLRNQGLSIG